MKVLKMCITCKQKCDRNVCELWITFCSVYKVETISVAFNWLIVLRSALRTCDQTTESFKMHLPRPKTCKKCMFMHQARRL